VQVLAAPVLGAQFAEYRIHMPPNTTGAHAADAEIEHLLFVLDGAVELSLESGSGTEAHRLASGGYALIPPSVGYRVRASEDASLLVLRKRYERLTGGEEFAPLVGAEQEVRGEVYMGDEGALLQTLIPDALSYDLAMNIFTFQTGHSLPVTETHVMEHGLYVLAGKGLYYLGDTWMEVEAGDFIWMGPFCPQSYYATGPTPTRYIYYKNVNREISL
jgi:(S)-ureidoglycine aminohydrolase